MTHQPFARLLVANRGEIARRIIRTAKRLGIWTIAVHSDVDANAPHALEADERHLIGQAPPRNSYLRGDRIIEVGWHTNANAIHPGYGFLSENHDFAREVQLSGMTFIGPPPEAMERVSNKLDARRIATELGVPVVPGSEALSSASEAKKAAGQLGYPVILKTAFGGGGAGMATVREPGRLERALADLGGKGRSLFGDDTVYMEKLIEGSAHVEVQVVADSRGHRVAVGERDCTVQRRHQKVLEEAPSPRIDDATRARMFDAALRLAECTGFENVGTVEMIVSATRAAESQFYFLEFNPRLQVEHPVTEAVSSIDLVEAQLRIAAGEPMPVEAAHPRTQGHAIEARVYAEDPDSNFFPSPGTVSNVVFPEMARVDSAVVAGTVVPPAYDPLIAKIIVHAADRPGAIETMRTAIACTQIDGVKTNLPIFSKILTSEEFRLGTHDTTLLRTLGYRY